MGIVVSIMLFLVHTAPVGLAELSVGVKAGDWAEYEAYYINTYPGARPQISGYRVEFQAVEGKNISVRVTTFFQDQTSSDVLSTSSMDAAKFQYPFLVPANLNKGDRFNVTFFVRRLEVKGVEEREYTGVKRTVVSATIPKGYKIFAEGASDNPVLYWDRATGMLVEADTLTSLTGAMLVVKISKTNLWENRPPGPDLGNIAIIAGVAAFTATTVTFGIRRSRNKKGAVSRL